MRPWKIALPMYAVTPHLRDVNAAFLAEFVTVLVERGWNEPVQVIEVDFAHIDEHWLDPRLLLSQTCGYPLMTRLQDQVRLLALPCYRAEGFNDGQYRSRLIVREDSRYICLEDVRGAVAVINSADSHSGMNALRHAVAPLATSGVFFRDVLVSGSHVNSIEWVRNGHAAIAAIDPVTWAHLADEQPARLTQVRTLGWSAPAPGLPLIGSRALSDAQAGVIRAALSMTLQRSPTLGRLLRIEQFKQADWADYQRIIDMQRDGTALPG